MLLKKDILLSFQIICILVHFIGLSELKYMLILMSAFIVTKNAMPLHFNAEIGPILTMIFP